MGHIEDFRTADAAKLAVRASRVDFDCRAIAVDPCLGLAPRSVQMGLCRSQSRFCYNDHRAFVVVDRRSMRTAFDYLVGSDAPGIFGIALAFLRITADFMGHQQQESHGDLRPISGKPKVYVPCRNTPNRSVLVVNGS
jgi:hypothetical protein